MIYYEIINGVYIEGTSGRLYKKDDWNNQEETNGIALITDNCQFVMAKSYTINLHAYNYEVEPGLPIYTTQESALTDYDGYGNTEKLAKAASDAGITAVGSAFYYCKEYTFSNGKNGYLASLGELKAIYDNLDSIKEAYSVIGINVDGWFVGGTNTSGRFWSSTRGILSDDNDICMWWMGMSNGLISYTDSTSPNNVYGAIPLLRLEL